MATITEWLASLGLSEYAQRFAENDIDVTVLRHLTDQDLKAIGVSLGHRRTCADIHDGPEQRSNERPDTLMQDPSPTRSTKKSLATHGRTIHWVKLRTLQDGGVAWFHWQMRSARRRGVNQNLARWTGIGAELSRLQCNQSYFVALGRSCQRVA